MEEEIRKLSLRKQKLLNAAEITKENKKKIINLVQNLLSRYNSGRISKRGYEEKMGGALGNKSAEEWIKYYDDYLDYYDYQIKLCDKLIKAEKKKERQNKFDFILKIFIFLVFIGIFISLFLILKPVDFDFVKFIGEKNFSLNLSFFKERAEIINESLPSVVLKSPYENIKFSEFSEQGPAVVGKQVEWVKEIELEEEADFELKLPADSQIISAYKIENDIEEELDYSFEIKKKNKFLGLFGKTSMNIKIKKESKRYKIKYKTPAPEIFEQVLDEKSGKKKRVIVEGRDDVHYENVLSFSEIPEILKLGEEGKIRLYEIKTENGNEIKEKILFTSYDSNENGFIDYIEWITPSLSSAVFEIQIIEITKAEHLDLNKNFISDIYENVKTLDNNWSEPIYNQEYIRVRFEKELDNSKDITIYARNNEKTNTLIEVYYFDSDEKITEFPVVNEEGKYKVFLNNMTGNSDVFDLRIRNLDDNNSAYLEFDYIVDPVYNFDNCMVLDNPNQVYTLIQNIIRNDLSDNCINISAQDITLDCNGYYIKSSNNYAGIYSNSTNTTIKNCNVSMSSSGAWSVGIYLKNANNSYIFNNTLNKQNYGLYLENSYNGTIEQNIIKDNSYGGGISLYSSKYLKFSNISLINNSHDGIYSFSSSENSFVNLTLINNSYGIRILGNSHNNIFKNIDINSSIKSALYLYAFGSKVPSNNSFINVRIDNTNVSHYDLETDYLTNFETIKNIYLINTSIKNYSFISPPLELNIINEFGEIRFLEALQEKGDNLSSDIQIKYNSVYVNSTKTGLNKSANITLYNLPVNFNYPVIKRDGRYICNENTNPSCYNFNSLNSGIVIFNVSSWSNYSVGEPYEYVSNCVILDKPDGFYMQTANIIRNDLTNDCIRILAQNIVFDCNGMYIQSNNNRAGIYSNSTNTTIKNCNVSMKTGDYGGYGIYLNSANNSKILNNTLNSQKFGLYAVSVFNSSFEDIEIKYNMFGIWFEKGSNNSFVNITANNNSDKGIFLISSSNNILINITANNNTYYGIYFYQNSNNNSLINSIANSNKGGIISESSGSFFKNVISVNNSEGGIFLSKSNNLIIDSNFSLNGYNDLRVFSNSINNTFLNCSYNSSKEGVSSGSELIRKWYYRAYADDGSGDPVPNVNVSAFDKTGNNAFNLTTDSSGYTDVIGIIDYANSGGVRNYYSNYTINATNGSLKDEHSYNVSLIKNNLKDVFYLKSELRVIYASDINIKDVQEASSRLTEFSFLVYSEPLNIIPGSIEGESVNGVFGRLINLNKPIIRSSQDSGGGCFYVKTIYDYNYDPDGAGPRISSNIKNYSCKIPIWYYDDYGSESEKNWRIEATIYDTLGRIAFNDSEKTWLKPLFTFSLNPSYLDWVAVGIGENLNKKAENNLGIYNTGNGLITNLNIRGYRLLGMSDSNSYIKAEWFKTGVSDSCNSVIDLIEASDVQVIFNLEPGENAYKELEFCLKKIVSQPENLITIQEYSTNAIGGQPWNIDAVFVFAAFALKRKKKKKKISNEELLDIFEEKFKNIEDKLYNLDNKVEEKFRIIDKKEIEKIKIPISIFRGELSPAEALCKYLKENLGLRYNEIAKLINRDQRTVWINYKNSEKKKIEKNKNFLKKKIEIEKNYIFVSIGIFSNRKLSILESVVNYLKEKGFRNFEIAEMLNKDQRIIGTLRFRIKKKLKK